MIELDVSRFKKPAPMRHQLVGIRKIIEESTVFIADKPRTGKSRQVVDAACVLRSNNLIDLVVILGPVPARGVWGDKYLGQIKKWSWLRSRVFEFRERSRELWGDENPELIWIVTNYEFLRTTKTNTKNLDSFLAHLASYKNILLVLDETTALGNEDSNQSKSVYRIRKLCSRCVMLNGTPGDPMKQYSQFNILNDLFKKRYKTKFTFKWQFTKYGPKELRQKKVFCTDGTERVVWQKLISPEIGWKNLDKLSKLTAPFVLSRKRKDCPELRDIPTTRGFREVPLTAKTWRYYKELRREALVELDTGEIYVTPNIGVKLLRLAQIVSGSLGGFEEGEPVRDLSSEKRTYLVDYFVNQVTAKRAIFWCRWRRERELLAEALTKEGVNVFEIYGGQKKDERRAAEMAFADGGPRLDTNLRYAIVAQPQAGGVALDMSAASEVFRVSMDYNPQTWEQSGDRPMGAAQRAEVVNFTDILAVSPDGARTMDHIIVAAMEEKINLEKMTTKWWRRELEEE